MREKGCFFLGKGENVNILDKSTRLVYVMLSPQPPFIIHKPTSSLANLHFRNVGSLWSYTIFLEERKTDFWMSLFKARG